MEIDQKDNNYNCNSFTNINLNVSPFKEKNKNSINSITTGHRKNKNSVDSKAYNSKSSKTVTTSNKKT